jgi:hypothetical protein
MVSLLQAFLMSIGVAALVLLSVLFGGWLVFKSKASPGERLIGPAPKGTVFTIPDAASATDIADEAPDKRMLERTEQFMEKLLGGK